MSQYRAYPAYKDSGVEWIGQVPEHWKVARVKRLASLRNERRNDVSTDTIYIGLEDVEAGSGQYKPTNGSSRQSEDSTVGIFYEGDVLYGKLRPYLRKAIISEMAGCCSTEFLVLRAEKTEPRWLQEWLLTPDVTHQIESGCEGAKMPRADWGHIGSIEVVYPDQPEQAKILTSLDRETARIDALIEKKTRFIELLKEKRQALITHAVTKGLDRNAKMKDSGIEWIGQVPEEWLNRKVFHAFQAIGSGTTPPAKEHEWYQGGTIPWITTSELRENTVVKTKKCVTSDAMQKFSALKIFPAGSLAIAMYGATIGRLGFLGIPATTNQACCVLSGERDLNIQFLYYWLMAFRADIVAFFSEGGGQPNINQEVIASLRVPSPASDEQATIVATLDRETARIDALISKAEQSITLLKERRAAFITAAVTGQIDLRGKQ
ncbi:restriction endonuclease subunit S [Klebsiella variicola]|nr:restriction endonuclease subunit S [Salmonella enterica]EBH9680578.1 restriction endonuclease subunit S [Salmonella enterica subsp. enterica serovar 4,[5],12:i:-]ECZ9980479.1 restriction endonuclease subunit S [Salmonella enterica subsp. enterica serovar Typhimurium]EBH9695843.1 restriction endonuclease subunit S [Salmonella enterica subsp. enterica serovar 4,[5],12:i:-]EBH9734759.1 restriction endonuclease subunit S [Salmonella enterica subsp. enterica serovar 4,[5],12:i:-]